MFIVSCGSVSWSVQNEKILIQITSILFSKLEGASSIEELDKANKSFGQQRFFITNFWNATRFFRIHAFKTSRFTRHAEQVSSQFKLFEKKAAGKRKSSNTFFQHFVKRIS